MQDRITSDEVNRILGITESYKMPESLMSILLDEERRIEVFKKFLDINSDLSKDWFTDYFQDFQGDRKALKQDFTPKCVTELISRLCQDSLFIYDICAGTGGLTISGLNHNKYQNIIVEEISQRTIPMLLFNMSIRGVNGFVKNFDSLTKEVFAIYKLTRASNGFSDIEIIDSVDDIKVSQVVSNPPYSLKWNPPNYDNRFVGYEIAPKSKADYAFILHILSKLNDKGEALIILPHGVLFRAAKEGKIRRKLIDNNLIDTIIGLPPKLFLNTGIPVCILKLKKNKDNTDILFVDASKDYVSNSKQNDLSEEHIDKIVSTVNARKDVEMYAFVSSYNNIKKNDYNLNIPRYVDTHIPEIIPDLNDTMDELIEIDKEIERTVKSIYEMTKNLVGTTSESSKKVEKFKRQYRELAREQDEYPEYEQLRLDIWMN